MEQRVENTSLKRRIIIDVISDLPDDSVINILSRLPADDVGHCRCVCRAWRDLTYTQEFVNIHLAQQVNVPPSILVNTLARGKSFDLIENWWESMENTPNREVFLDFPGEYHVLLSHNGLILFGTHRDPPELFILNPANGEYVFITFQGGMWNTWRNYGVYFHPLLKEYCTLWRSNKKYKLLVMGSTPYVKDIDNPLYGKARAVGTPPPILLNGHLYWMAEPELSNGNYDIIEFGIKSEKFVLIPCSVSKAFVTCYAVRQPSPRYEKTGRVCADCITNSNIGLLNIDGLVSVVQITTKEKLVITIWTLKDRLGKLWETSCYSGFTTQGFRWNYKLRPIDKLRSIAFANGELFLSSAYRMLVCNLKSKTVRYIGSVTCAVIVPHFKTLASLGNSKFDMSAMRTRHFPERYELREIIEETSGGRIQIIWKLLNRAQAKN